MKNKPCFLSPDHRWFWVTSMVIAFVAIIAVEVLRFCFSENDCNSTETISNVFEGIALSYIAAVVFQWVVVYIPHQKRKEILTPLIKRHLWKIKESLRECKTIPHPYLLTLNDKQQSKEEFIDEFSKCNLLMCYMTENGCSKESRLNTLKEQIDYSVDVLLSNKEYLTDSQLEFVNYVISSSFMQNVLVPNDEVCDSYSKNQNLMGECIYDLYEEAKVVCHKQ